MPGNKRAISDEVFDVPTAPAGPPAVERNFMLFIAIDHYEQSRLDLGNPVRDANNLLQVLCKKYKFSPESESNVTDLRDTDNRYGDRTKYRFPIYVYNDKYIHCLYNEQANPGNIKAAINAIKAHITKDDNLLIYFAGHGYMDKDTLLWYFTHYNHEIQNPNGLPFFETAMSASKRSGEICCKNLLFILDSCFSGNVLNGFVGQNNPNYGLLALTSTGGTELAADGKIMQGSPFSTALIKVLLRNKRREIDAKELLTELKKLFNEPNQTLQLGIIPNTDGLSTFKFTLKNPEGEYANSFAETIFNHLNFLEERNIIEEEVNNTLNTEYIVLSSVSSEDRFHRLIGNVCSRILLKKVKLTEPPRTVMNVFCNDGNIWGAIARKLSLPATHEDVEELVLEALNDQLMTDFITPDATAETIAPYFIGLFFENLTPQQTLNIKAFCERLLVGIHKKKLPNIHNGIEYSPLFLFIFDIRSGTNLFSAGNLKISPADCSKTCSPFILFHSQNPSKSTIRLGQAETWFDMSKHIFESNSLFKLREDWVTQQFSQKNDVSMIDFILAAAQETGLQLPDITQIIFKTN